MIGTTDADKAAIEEKRKKNRESQAKRRQRIKQAKIAAQAVLDNQTLEEFWRKNRTVANQTHIAELQEREEYVLALLDDMELAMEGSHNEDDELWLESVREEVEADVKQFGAVAIETGLLGFHRDPNTFAMLMGKVNSATQTFIRFGIITGIPGHRLHQWQEHLKVLANPAQPAGNGYVMLQCACKTPITSFEAVPISIAELYEKAGKRWLCTRCRAAEQNARAQASTTIELRKPTGPSTIFDSWGRIKTPEQEKEV
jgi:hypothetical protein